jgi:rhodanese-related sulfurtransferase
MKFLKLLQLLALSALLAGYAAWVGDRREACKIKLVGLAEAEALWREKTTVFLDVRSAADYDFGHIRGALSLPYEEFEERFPALKTRLQQAGAIVVYCKSIDCAKSLWTAIRLRKKGLTQTRIYPEGWYEWSDHGKPASRPRP